MQEYAIINKVILTEIGLKPKRPKVETTIAIRTSNAIATSIALLGIESQNLPGSLAMKIENIAKKNNISKTKVFSVLLLMLICR